MISLINDTISLEDIELLIEWLKTNPRLTKGPLTLEYENKWSNWLGTKYSVFVNSGSSANLLMLYSLKESGRIRNNKIIIPNLCWATDLAPAVQLGFEPLLCDCNMDNLSVDLSHLEKLFIDYNPSCLLLVSILGLSPNIYEIQKLCAKYSVILLEDNCESMGTQFDGSNLGTFGLMSTYSTYFGHHISTIEGGMVCTNDKEIYNILLSIRSHGWDRDWLPEDQNKIRSYYNINSFDALYTFYYAGMNLRSTDLQAFIGINQLNKLKDIFEVRNKNFNLYQKYLKNSYWKPAPIHNSYTSNFAYPVIHPKKYEIVSELINNKIEVRPLVCGSMHSQPFFKCKNTQNFSEFPNTTKVTNYGFYVPNHPKVTEDNIKFICNLINTVIA